MITVSNPTYHAFLEGSHDYPEELICVFQAVALLSGSIKSRKSVSFDVCAMAVTIFSLFSRSKINFLAYPPLTHSLSPWSTARRWRHEECPSSARQRGASNISVVNYRLLFPHPVFSLIPLLEVRCSSVERIRLTTDCLCYRYYLRPEMNRNLWLNSRGILIIQDLLPDHPIPPVAHLNDGCTLNRITESNEEIVVISLLSIVCDTLSNSMLRCYFLEVKHQPHPIPPALKLKH